jgi:CheY-like chemotaxis protein
MIKILVFENEIPAVSEAFNDVNILDFNNELEVTFVDKSQNFRDFRQVNKFDLIFVDIDLSSNSEKDGYGIIEDLKRNNYHKIVVLTGNIVRDELKKRGWNDIKILSKPIFLDELTNLITECKPI